MADQKSAGKSEKKPVYETQESLYKKAMAKLAADDLIVQPAYKISNYKLAAAMFEEVGDYLDAPQKAQECRQAVETAQELAKQARYEAAKFRMQNAEDVSEWEHLAKEFSGLKEYEDSQDKAAFCAEQARKLENRRRNRLRGFLAVVVLIAAGAGISYHTGFYRYLKGRVLQKAGMYASAETTFETLPGFLDSDAQAAESTQAALASTKIGSDVKFGTYKWKILSRENGKVRMIAADIGSTHLFYRRAFHEGDSANGKTVTWAGSSLREWLNGEVVQEIFTDSQREMLVLQECGISENEVYGTSYKEETQDYLTLLSAEEIADGRYEQSLKELGHDYWLRTPGASEDLVAYLNADHAVRAYGVPADDEGMMVRPVILVCYADAKD